MLPQDASPDGRHREDIIDDDNHLHVDPRRFTPTLHASLVSEILALRRDVEGKSKAIDELEHSLHESRTENEGLNDDISQTRKESRSLKRQLQLLDGGTSSALSELAKERDEAQENISDVRKRLEQAQKKIRSREDEAERTQMLWDREREGWETERRNMERKVHVVEGRLKVVLHEVAAAHAAGTINSASKGDGELGKEGAAARESDSVSIQSSSQGRRRTSVTSMSSEEGEIRNPRFSVASAVNGQAVNNDSLNLADELAFDEDEEFGLPEETPGSPDTLPEERPMSVNSQGSHSLGMKARKILGLGIYQDENAREMGTPVEQSFVETRVNYQDAGIQSSPRLSRKPRPESAYLRFADDDKRKSLPESQTHRGGQMKDSGTLTMSNAMVSTGCQTIGDLLSPPLTPKPLESSIQPVVAPKENNTVSASTQTEPADTEKPSPSSNEASDMEVPTISIQPPRSEPPSRRNSVVLPPQTRSASCQVNFRSVVEGRSIAIQTEGIRIDQRPVKLPASLLPSAIQDLPLDNGNRDHPIQPYHPPPPRLDNGKRRSWQRTAEPPPIPPKNQLRDLVQAYPDNNDNGPLSEDYKSDLRRPFRSSSLFAGFDDASDEESPEAKKDPFTDDDLLNRPFASYTLRRGKLISAENRPLDETALPEIDEHLAECDSRVYEKAIDNEGTDQVPSLKGQRPDPSTFTHRQQDVRRAALVSSGAAAHQKPRSRSPSEPSITSAGSSIPPPFPVPVRLSSRKFPTYGSEGRQSPTPPSSRNFSDRPRQPVRRPTLRKVRSAAAMAPTNKHERSGSTSSQVMSTSSYAPDSPQRPPLPFDDITARRRKITKRPPHQSPSQHFTHERKDSTATVQQTSVVDAIAQTMVGEWMFKYIRRRKSFGVNEEKSWEGRNPEEMSANITSNGVRHKRWVWLAPYERAIMWSSKQPTTGPALLGKSGRKCEYLFPSGCSVADAGAVTIQSVLDVNDENPMPKGNGQVNRSILILTPQRALKFTATTIERHYVWLTALSFLSHSDMGLHDLDSLPPVPQEEFSAPAPTAALRRNPIRDSIRVAKGKPRPGPKGKHSVPSEPAVPELPTELDFSMDAADPPNVPRFSSNSHSHSHSRKRSNTTTRLPALRSFSSHGTMPSSHSGTTAGSPDGPPPIPNVSHGFGSGRSSLSHRVSEASGPSSVNTGNFFDAIGTVRMEAFIDRSANRQRPRHGPKHSGPWGQGHYDYDYPHAENGSEVYARHDDPFRGF